MLGFASVYETYAQKQGYSDDFNSVQEIRNYLSANIALLDPLEGEYDVEQTGEYITPIVHQYYPKTSYKLFIVGNNDTFNVYMLYKGELYESYYRFETIGETNAYRMFCYSSSARIFLQDNIRFKATIQLDHSSAKKFTGNNRLHASIQIPLYFDCIKVYPTSKMYADATRKAIEEAQPTEWTGTGFALKDNYIVTNNHVVDGANNISIKGINGDFINKYNADVVATDKVNDLAIIRVNGISISSSGIPYAVKTNTSEVGEEVFVLGYPLTSTMGEEIKLTTGVISSRTGFQGDVSIYQISAPIQPGNSGGPLFDSKGNVIGIVSAKHKGAENVGYAIKASYLRNLMESIVPTNILPQTNKMANINLSGKVKSAKNYVYYILCSSSGNGSSRSNNQSNMHKTAPPSNDNNTSIDNKQAPRSTVYRVQAFKGINTVQGRIQAEDVKKKLGSSFPNEKFYIHFYTPNWTCRMGDYQSYDKANKMLLEVKKLGYNQATIVEGEIVVKDN